MTDTSWTQSSQDELLTELDGLERAIARSRTLDLYVDATGRSTTWLRPEVLALAEQQHLIVTELRRRIHAARPAA